MAGKEKKATVTRQLSKENVLEKDKSVAPDTLTKRRARKSVVDASSPKGKASTPRVVKKKAKTADAEPKVTTPKGSRKRNFEKELEDLLENATGRNTPSDGERSTPGKRRDDLSSLDVANFSLKSKKDVDDDTLSVRSLTTFLRTRKNADRDLDDDLFSLRNVRLRKDDDDNASVRSLPVKNNKKKPNPPKVKNVTKVVKPQKGKETKAVKEKKKPKAKDNKQAVVKKAKAKLPNKAAQQRSKILLKKNVDLLIKKKVKKAQNAVKRIIKKKATLKGSEIRSKDATLPVTETNGDVAKTTAVTVKKTKPKVVAKPKVTIRKKPVKAHPAAGVAAAKASTSAAALAVASAVKTTVDVPAATAKSVISAAKKSIAATASPASAASRKKGPKRRWESGLTYETKQSPDDSQVIIVQPRLAPKMRRTSRISSEPVVLVAVPNGSPNIVSPGPSSGPQSPNSNPISSASPAPSTVSPGLPSPGSQPPSSTPYLIQNMPNFNVFKPQPNVQGDWLVTPTGVVLIQAVPPPERASRAEIPEVISSPLTPVAPPQPSCSESAHTDSALSEKAKEAEPAQEVALPIPIPVAKNVSELLLIKSRLEPLTGGSTTDAVPPVEELSINFKRSAARTGRRASHDGTLGSRPSRLISRRSSCERLARSPRPILELGCEPLQINELVGLVETDSTFSRTVPERAQSTSLTMDVLPLPPPSALEPVAEELKESQSTDEGSSSLYTPPESLDSEATMEMDAIVEAKREADALVESQPDVTIERKSPTPPPVPSPPCPTSPSSPSVAPAIDEIAVVNEEETQLPNGVTVISPEDPDSDRIVIDIEMDPVLAENRLPLVQRPSIHTERTTAEAAKRCPKEELRGLARTKKYSRSLDSRQKLLPALRRRSHPETRIINIVTCEDGSRQGQPVAEELRKQCARDVLLESEEKVPYLDPPPPSPPPKVLLLETPEELASKETILSALGLQSLKAAAESAQKKKERIPVVSASSSINNNYTGTLKTVIKIQRPEKKGNGRMIYKASSAGTGTEAVSQEEELTPEMVASTKESQDSGDEDSKNGNGKAKALVIPEKASSFSIHPQRVCSDVCTYCFGKFGLLDTPCHIAQLKDGDKRRNILSTETHLTLDSCLCDACFRHVDKKSNCPSYTERKPSKRKLLPRKVVECCVINCDTEATHNVRRKSILKLKKSLGKKLTLDQNKVEKLQPVGMVPLCSRHNYWVDYFMSCGICNKRLNNVHMHRVGSEAMDLNGVLNLDGIPTVLTEKRFLCKLCHCYTSIRLKVKNPSELSTSQRQFYETCKRRILRGHGLAMADSEPESAEVDIELTKNGKPAKSMKRLKPSSTVSNGVEEESENSRKSEESVRSDGTSEELSDLRARFRSHPVPSSGFHKFSATLQFTPETKNLFYEMQRPYGNHSSFMRHLILLEKYFRNGDLVMSRNAGPQAVKYINGVQNRLRSYDGMPKVTSRPFTLIPVPSTSAAASNQAPQHQQQPPPPPPSKSPAVVASTSPLSQMQATVQSIGLKPEISITSVGQEPRKLTPKIQENLRALANRSSKPPSEKTRAVILNRTVGGQKQSLVQVTTGGKTIHLTLPQFRRIQQMQLKKKQILEQAKSKSKAMKANGPSEGECSISFPNIPKALSVSVTKVPNVDLTKSSSSSD